MFVCIVVMVHAGHLIEVNLRDVCVGRRVDMFGWYHSENNGCIRIVACFGNK